MILNSAPIRTKAPNQVAMSAMVILAAVGFAAWRAWVSDDAHITFRHVDHCRLGYGPVFNPGDRVQGFSHPLWFLLLLAGAWFLDVYALAVGYGLALTAGLFGILAGVWRRNPPFAAGFCLSTLMLLSSRSFVEYQTSGLENALTHFVSSVLWAYVFSSALRGHAPQVGRTALLCALLIMNRIDLAAFCAPLLVWIAAGSMRRRDWRSLLRLVAGLLPGIAWYAFATLYYGSPLPNPYYAKLALTRGEGIVQGARYALDYAQSEPLHAGLIFIVVLAGLALGIRDVLRRTQFAGLWLALPLGVLLNLAGLLSVGGDFMRGRFFVMPLVAAVIFAGFRVSRSKYASAPWWVYFRGEWVATGMLVVAGASSLWDFVPRRASREDVRASYGIADEWAHYAGEWNENRFRPPRYDRNPAVAGFRARGRDCAHLARMHGKFAVRFGALGMLAYEAGPNVHVLDPFGLTDAYVARCAPIANSRIGHFRRAVPNRYWDSYADITRDAHWRERLAQRDATLVLEALQRREAAVLASPDELERTVERVIRGPILTAERLGCIPGFFWPHRQAAVTEPKKQSE